MAQYVADPGELPPFLWPAMLNRDYARERAAADRSPESARRRWPGSPRLALVWPPRAVITVYLSVVDRAGNMVSLIQSNFASFGSGIVAEGTGFPLQNRGAAVHARSAAIRTYSRRASARSIQSFQRSCLLFLAGAPRPTRSRSLAGPLRPAPLASLRRVIAFGIMGGWNQSQAHAQFVSNVVDHGMNIQAALEAARFTKLSFDGNDVAIERRISADAQRDLARARSRTARSRGISAVSWAAAGRR